MLRRLELSGQPDEAAQPFLELRCILEAADRVGVVPFAEADEPARVADVAEETYRTGAGPCAHPLANSVHASTNASSSAGSTSNRPYVKISYIAPPRVSAEDTPIQAARS